ncbi:hypothetical protein MPTK1_8g03420 [Marchantia polymorpha subsp. ruderalis]|uniref:RRM domain-containing protein n=1 Tax=Marchantia polymorpha TaxID=3197 RepID=A0A2R6XJB8_MARPO|nr:hypothetical protein MARPO_0012s0133 [Marchantia polymorpha]BBN18556.1 hypothetical protein Mp_8g03420 [Marchantia polymorpha subsp. ruderalis]|eukprot:PTQ46203.1 hypothetical protein MARPO_0012s0133 [Marchantia polymorpha]
MAASCISVTVSAAASLVAVGRSVESGVSSQTARHGLAFPSISASCSVERKLGSGLSFFSFSSRTVRNNGLVARAVELDETKDGILFSDDTPDSEPAAVEETPAPAAGTTKLYVGNLPWSVDSKALAEIFQDSGNVELVEVIYDRDTQRSRGFAFVTMRTSEDAERAIETLDGYELEGRVLKVNYPQTSKDGPRSFRNDRPPRRDGEGFSPRSGGGSSSVNKIFTGNLSWSVDDVALAQLFSEYGQVVDAKVVHDRETGRSRGFGFCTMSSKTEVDNAIQALDGAEFDGRILRVNHAGDKPERRDSPRREY